MVYCQDCGASNDPANTACRICSHTLGRPQSQTPCIACEALLGEGALFCSRCGTPVPVLTGAMTAGAPSRLSAMAHNDNAGRPTGLQAGFGDGIANRRGPNGGEPAASSSSGRDFDTFDTSSLVSEEDLPAWLRQAIQVEEADEAQRKREEEAVATAAARDQEALQQRARRRESEQQQKPVDHHAEPNLGTTQPSERGAEPAVPVAEAHSRPHQVDEEPLRASDSGTDANAVPEPEKRRLRRRGTAKPAQPAASSESTERRTKVITPRSLPWEGHGDKVVLIVSLALIALAIVLLAPGMLR